MKTEPVTRDAFDAMRFPDRRQLPETVKVLALDLYVGVRFKDHKHTCPPSTPTMCTLGNTLRNAAATYRMRVVIHHDGADLIVFRLK